MHGCGSVHARFSILLVIFHVQPKEYDWYGAYEEQGEVMLLQLSMFSSALLWSYRSLA